MASCTLNKELVRTLVSSWSCRETAINYFGIKSERRVLATVQMCSPGVLAGVPFVDALFKEFGCTVKWNVADGDVMVDHDLIVATVTGCLGDLLSCEKLAVSILSRASGITSYGRKLSKLLSEISWKGKMRVPRSLTPGFDLVEEYAMLLAGLTSIKPTACVRGLQAVSAGGVDVVVRTIRSAAPGVPIEVECENIAQASEAANSGADILIFNQVPQEIGARASQLKTSHPQIRIQLSGEIDEANLKTYALPCVDLLATSKLSNGYPLVMFRVTYGDDVAIEEESKLVEFPLTESPAEMKLQSPVDVTVDGVVSSTESAPKKARLGDSQSDSPKPSGNKQNGTPAPNANQPGSPSISGTNTPREQSHKRSQRNQRPQHNTPQRQNLPRTQAAGGLQLMQMASRFMAPNTPTSRAQLNSPQPGFNLNSQLPGVLGQQAPPNVGLRIPGQSLPQRMSPGMLGTGPNVNPGFLGIQSPQQQNMSQQNWPMMAGGAAQMMGGVGIGMRMGSPGQMPNCRSCGTANGPGLPFCRNCRTPLR
ncbi:Nicotinate-nucleotide pyrophosphorylase [carboxylating] [Clonorchis sinensis]|uniref:Quinolinate phosphoribosyltransferase [decarboxylating] n=1 Tax=Clonorchis sinensis TaxID=79923 RepID=A0A8T1MKM1_CLOSI|nr:Nicotinate-nucleotide pyrophosphorylase [carboxylating] [Clonorchis sinensis]